MFKLLILASEQNQISTWKSFTPSIDFIFMACARTASKDNDDYFYYNENNNDDADSNGGSDNRDTFDDNS